MKDERLYRLYRLHKIDSRLMEIKNEAEHLDVGSRELAAVKKIRAEAGEDLRRHEDLTARTHQIRTSLDQIESKRDRLNRELFSGSIGAKEAEAIQQELENIGDQEVQLAIELEEAEAQLAPLIDKVGEVSNKVEAFKNQAAKKRGAAEVRHKELQALFRQVGETRAATEAEVDKPLLANYASARKRSGNTGMTLITPDDRCESCGIHIAPKIKESVQNGKVTPCESCGRILFVIEEAVDE